MCDICKDILKKCVNMHEIKDCPLQKVRYCSLCASYGHTIRFCTKDLRYRKPLFLEQLIPPSILEEHGILTRTPLNSTIETILSKPKVYLDYVDNPKAIRALLKAHGDMPRKEDRDKEKYKKHLETTFMKKRNVILVKHILEKNDEHIDE